tara:strand:+ start:49609 stop:50280 length:672 start_codon:yes stop_codon:yes gene_type:complete
MTALDYCTLADVEAYCGVNFSDGIGPTDNEINTILIPNASRLLDDFAGRQLAGSTTVTDEYHDTHYGQRHLVLNFRPISAITNIWQVDSSGNEKLLVQGRTRSTDDYWLDDGEAGLIRFNATWTGDIANQLKVAYNYGYATVPIYAKMACITLVVSQCARASLNDENCMDRVKEMWRELLQSSLSDYRDALKQFKSHAQIGVAAYGTLSLHRPFSTSNIDWGG